MFASFLMECFRCGVSGDKVFLHDAISQKGIVKICRKCSFEEGLPIIQKPDEYGQVKPKQSIPDKVVFSGALKDRKALVEKQNEMIRKVLDKSVIESSKKSKKMENLVDNFHWKIMRARRANKITQGQLAEKINEAPAMVMLAEKGFVAEGKYEFVKKIESALGIKILKEDKFASFDEELKKIKSDFIRGTESGKINFDRTLAKSMTTSDLKELEKPKDENSGEEAGDVKKSRGFLAWLFGGRESEENEKEKRED